MITATASIHLPKPVSNNLTIKSDSVLANDLTIKSDSVLANPKGKEIKYNVIKRLPHKLFVL